MLNVMSILFEYYNLIMFFHLPNVVVQAVFLLYLVCLLLHLVLYHLLQHWQPFSSGLFTMPFNDIFKGPSCACLNASEMAFRTRAAATSF